MPLLRRYILLLLTLLSFTLQAQQYPVDVQVFVTPPYPQSLRGYADSFEQKIQAHFLLKDLSTGGRPFALRFSLENFQGQVIAQTPDYITPYLVNLSPGVRRTLTNIDFKTLLRYENLYGINEATYNGLLPEGTYFIGLSLYDVATGRPVSNKGRAMIQVRRYSPPVLTMPQKGEVLTKKNAFQNILFQWMPRDIAPFMQYEFTLKEVWDLALVPEEAFMSGRLVYQTKTNAPALQYTNMMPILLENKRYVWQVRALTNNPTNPNEQSYFRNNGNSETFYFDLVSNCEAPRMLTAMTESTSAQLRWSAQAMMPNQEYPYKVMYREKGKSWKSQKVSMPYAKVIGLKRGRTYIYKVGVACGLNAANSTSVFGEDSYVYSTEQEFTTTEQIDEKSQVQCGVKPEIRIKNTEPLQDNLYPNTTFRAGDFPVTVLNATGSNGVYSGEGYVKVPYLQDTKIKVVFNGIKLNTERQLIEGKLVTTYDETERNVQFIQEGIGEVFGDKGKKDQKMPFEVAEVQVDSITGRITITGKVDPKTGIAPKVTLPKGKDYVITDSQGKVYQLDESGKVTAKGTREQGTQLAQQAGKGDSKNPPISNKHFKVEWLFNDELANDTNGEIPYKALVKGKTSSFELRIQPADTTKYDFFFHTENGVKVEAESKGEGLYKITRKGAFDFAQEELWVVAKEKKDKKGKKEELIGKCILVHLSPKEVNVALVPTQSGQNLQEAIAQVQQIYEKVGVTLHITTEKPFDISDQLKNGTLPTENEFGDLSTYSPEQNAVIAKFATNRKPKDNTYYIFLVNDGTGNHGYMRLGGQYGFVYSANARTIAHELGHGIFKLEHPFKGKNADKGKTTALMDYNEGQDFFYRDWKQINDPKVKLYAFQKQSEGEFAGGYAITPNYKVFMISGTKTVYDALDYSIENNKAFADDGTLAGFSLDGVNYYWDYTSNDKYISGIQDDSKTYIPIAIPIKSLDKNKKIFLFFDKAKPCNEATYNTVLAAELINFKGNLQTFIQKYNYNNKILHCSNSNATNEWDKLYEKEFTPCDKFSPVGNAQFYQNYITKSLQGILSKITNEKRKLGVFNHIHYPEFINEKLKGTFDILEDKFYLLSTLTEVDLTITYVNIPGNSYIPKEKLLQMAKNAIKEVNHKRKLVYIVIPYSKNGLENTYCSQLVYAENTPYTVEKLSKIKSTDTKDAILNIFSSIRKPLIISRVYKQVDGKIIERIAEKTTKNVVGYPFIKILNFYESKGYEEGTKLNEKWKDRDYQNNYLLYVQYEKEFLDIYNKYLVEEEKINSFNNPNIWKQVSNEDLGKFREIYCDDNTLITELWTKSKESWTWKNKVTIAINVGKLNKNHFYNFDKLTVLDDVVYGTIDAIGLVPGLDTFTDPIGAVYAGVRGDLLSGVIYSASFSVPLAGSAYIKGALNAGEDATKLFGIVAKKADNADGFILEIKQISDITSNELHVSSAYWGGDKQLTRKILNEIKDDSKFIDKNHILRQLNDLEKGKQIANLAEDLSKKTNNILTKAFSEGSKFIDDTKTIEKITHYLAPENAEKLKAIGGESGLKNFLAKYKDAPCGNCKDAGRKIFGGRTIDEMLENYIEVAYTFRNRPDLWKKIEEGALSSNAAMREGTQHMLSTFKKNPKKYAPENIEHLDMKFEKGSDAVCANCRYDVKFISKSKPLYEEFKSYNTETWSKIANDKGFIQQFKSYLNTEGIEKIEDLAYVINSNKANINEVKQAFKEVFKRNSDEILEIMSPELKKSLGLINKNREEVFKLLIKDTNSPLYNFIKSQ